MKLRCLAFFLMLSLGGFLSTVDASPIHDHDLPTASPRELQTLTNTGMDWPSLWDVIRVATLQNYNTRLVVCSTTLLGAASGLIGTFLLLRKRSLMGDALSHACLPGIGLMFMLMVAVGGNGKFLPGLLLGAAITGVIGVVLVLLIRNTTRIKDDAAMGLVLSVMFGIGVAVLGMVQAMPGASAAGLEYFIYGKTASMVMQDFLLISAVAVTVTFMSMILFKEFTLVCFDEGYASTQGWPVNVLDVAMLGLVTTVTVVGMQAVGLMLIIAFLITPSAAARFWTENLKRMLLLSGMIGAISGWLGSSISALLPRLPAGAVIVVVAAAIFLVSMIFGSSRGVLLRMFARRRLNRKVGRQHLLRAVYELVESRKHPEMTDVANVAIGMDELLLRRSWTRKQLEKLIRVARREDHIEYYNGKLLRLSEPGFGEAARITRNHRLWEMYLIKHADVAAAHVDRDADAVEHVLGAEMVRKLEAELVKRGQALLVPPSPHTIITGA
ncbi:MAG: iron chelate uptake ABC transporter family permease subunit [Phycisphaeraceae bacterium JB051]